MLECDGTSSREAKSARTREGGNGLRIACGVETCRSTGDLHRARLVVGTRVGDHGKDVVSRRHERAVSPCEHLPIILHEIEFHHSQDAAIEV